MFLSQGLGMGLGAGLVFAPCTTAVGVHFRRRRSLAIGLSLTGASVGAVAFPISKWASFARNVLFIYTYPVLKWADAAITSSITLLIHFTSNLFPILGFGSTVRVTGYISLGCLLVGNCLIWPRQIVTRRNMPTPNMLNFFRDPPYVLFLIG